MNKTMGTLHVDFAGTREEAREFVRANVGLQLAHQPSPDGLPQLSLRYVSENERLNGMALLGVLGWAGCVQNTPKVCV